MLIAGIIPIFWLVFAISRSSVLQGLARSHFVWVVMPLPFFGLATGFSGNTTFSNLLAGLFILGILLTTVGGIFALRKPILVLVLAGSIGALLCVPVLGIAALVLIVKSRSSFVKLSKH